MVYIMQTLQLPSNKVWFIYIRKMYVCNDVHHAVGCLMCETVDVPLAGSTTADAVGRRDSFYCSSHRFVFRGSYLKVVNFIQQPTFNTKNYINSRTLALMVQMSYVILKNGFLVQRHWVEERRKETKFWPQTCSLYCGPSQTGKGKCCATIEVARFEP